MKEHEKRWAKLFVPLLALALIAVACGSDGSTSTTEASSGDSSSSTAQSSSGGSSDDSAAEPASTEPVAVCELAYYTGDFADLGESLTADVTFPVEQVINDDPPLGRTWEVFAEDIGTVGEAQGARACLERHDADIVVSIAHGYREYRDFMLEYWEENDAPIVPSVHGGSIPGNIGGTGDEPIFRAQGLDAGLGTSGILYAESIDAKKVVIFQTEVEGFILASDAAEGAAEAVGIEVLARIRAQPGQPSYRAQVEQIADLEPDAVLVQANTVDSGGLIKQAAESGLSLTWIGETGWTQPEFVGTLGIDLIDTQESIGFAAFAHDDGTPAWEYFSEAWDTAPGYGDTFGAASDLYHFSTYDVMVQTALAVEAAGSYSASAWAPAMYEVGSAPGTQCFTYEACLALLRSGEDIDYEGVTGNGDYTEGGVNNVSAAYTPINTDGTQGSAVFLDADRSLEIVDAVAPLAECDGDTCDW